MPTISESRHGGESPPILNPFTTDDVPLVTDKPSFTPNRSPYFRFPYGLSGPDESTNEGVLESKEDSPASTLCTAPILYPTGTEICGPRTVESPALSNDFAVFVRGTPQEQHPLPHTPSLSSLVAESFATPSPSTVPGHMDPHPQARARAVAASHSVRHIARELGLPIFSVDYLREGRTVPNGPTDDDCLFHDDVHFAPRPRNTLRSKLARLCSSDPNNLLKGLTARHLVTLEDPGSMSPTEMELIMALPNMVVLYTWNPPAGGFSSDGQHVTFHVPTNKWHVESNRIATRTLWHLDPTITVETSSCFDRMFCWTTYANREIEDVLVGGHRRLQFIGQHQVCSRPHPLFQATPFVPQLVTYDKTPTTKESILAVRTTTNEGRFLNLTYPGIPSYVSLREDEPSGPSALLKLRTSIAHSKTRPAAGLILTKLKSAGYTADDTTVMVAIDYLMNVDTQAEPPPAVNEFEAEPYDIPTVTHNPVDVEGFPTMLVLMNSPFPGAKAIPMGCLENEGIYVQERLERVRPQNPPVTAATTAIFEAMHHFAQHLFEEVNVATIATIDEVRERQNRPGQRLLIEKGAERLGGDVDRGMILSFLKGEQVDPSKPTRGIAPVQPVNKLANSMVGIGLTTVVKKAKFYAFGMDLPDTETRVCAVLAGADSAGEVDMSKMDATIQQILRRFDLIILTRLFLKDDHEFVCAWYHTVYGNRCKTRHGLEFYQGYSQASGDPFTSILHTLRSAFVDYLHQVQRRIPSSEAYSNLGIYGGDDALIRNINAEAYMAAAKSLGLVAKVETKSYGESVQFLSRAYSPGAWDVCSESDQHSIAMPKRALLNLCATSSKTTPPLEALYYKALSLLVTDANNLGPAAWAKAILRHVPIPVHTDAKETEVRRLNMGYLAYNQWLNHLPLGAREEQDWMVELNHADIPQLDLFVTFMEESTPDNFRNPPVLIPNVLGEIEITHPILVHEILLGEDEVKEPEIESPIFTDGYIPDTFEKTRHAKAVRAYTAATWGEPDERNDFFSTLHNERVSHGQVVKWGKPRVTPNTTLPKSRPPKKKKAAILPPLTAPPGREALPQATKPAKPPRPRHVVGPARKCRGRTDGLGNT
jgi:hypothetical protein